MSARNILLTPWLVWFAMLSAPVAAEPHPQAGDALIPVRVSWRELSRTREKAVLVAVVERSAMLAVPLMAKVVVPEGCALVGDPGFTVAASKEASVEERRYELRYRKTPKEDVRLVVDAGGRNFGLHFDVPYRFGREAPAMRTVAKEGPSIRVGGTDLGRSVRMTP